MSHTKSKSARAQRRQRPARRRPPQRFSQEVVQLGDTTASLPRPVRRGVIRWVREMLALARQARREFSSVASKVLPPGRGTR